MRTQHGAAKSEGYKGLRPGFRKESIRKIFDEEGPEAALAKARKLKIKESSAKTWMSGWRRERAVTHISIRELQKISGETIRELPGLTPIKSGDKTVALLIPLKTADAGRLAEVLARAEALAKGRDPVRDDEALAQFGDVDPVDWSIEKVRELKAETRKR